MVTTSVVQLGNKTVNTRFGPKETHSFKGGDGEWYSLGFKKPTFSTGSQVSFEVNDTTYGKQVVDGTLKVLMSSSDGKETSTVKAADKPMYGRPAKVFPVPPLDGDRAIIRQNALTNARELFCASQGGNSFAEMNADDIANAIITMARKFEAYTAGDIDAAKAEKMMKKSKKTEEEGND